MSGRYHRLPLPTEGAPLEEQFDAFIRFLRVSRGKAPGLRGHIGLGFALVPGQACHVGEHLLVLALCCLLEDACACSCFPFPLL